MRKSHPQKRSQFIEEYQQQYQYTEDSDLDTQQPEPAKKKKPVPIPRFIKNQIDQIDTNVIVLNISKTQYQIVQEVANELGWQVQTSKKSQKWDVMWIDSHIQSHDLFKLNQHQKISHFPAIYVLTRKNFLGRSLMKMRNYFPEEYNFFPSTWSIPADFTELLRFHEKLDKQKENLFYIYKPQALSQGKGIKLYENVDLLDGKTGIVQQYLNNPFLIQNLKFDLRIYVLILGYDPLRIFIYDQGLGRFATQKYEKVKKKNMKDVHMHLTNYAINKNSKNFIFNNSEKDMNKGHKRSLTAIYTYLTSKGIDVTKMKNKIDQMIIKTLIVGQPMIAHTYGLSQADTQYNELCFHILGFDVLIDQNLQPKLLEVNHTPSFKTETPLDKFIKKNLIKDTLVLLNINTENKKVKLDKKRQYIQMRSMRKLTKLTNQQKQQMKKKKAKERDQYELSHLGNFRKIFPTQQTKKYKQMIEISNKIFNETHGIKNKSSLNSKLLVSVIRPKSFDKGISNTMEASPLLTSIKQKLMLDEKYSKTQALYIKENQDDKQKKKIQSILRSSKQKFPTINSPKRNQKSRNFSAYMAANIKNQLLKSAPGINNGIHKLQRTNSFNKNPLNTCQIQSQLFQRGNYVLPKVLEMGQIGVPVNRSTQLYSNNSLSSSFTPGAITYTNSQTTTGVISKLCGSTKVCNNVNINLSPNSKQRNFQQVSSQASIQISAFSPCKNKMTYQNLLNSLTFNANTMTNIGNNKNEAPPYQNYSHSREEFIRLKPLRKF